MEKSTLDFLLFSVLGITQEDAKDFELAKYACINRAYLDAARRVLKTKDNPEIRNNGTIFLMKCITEHRIESAEKIIEQLKLHICKDEDKVTIGIIQKWVNMTYKYLIMLYDATSENKSLIDLLLDAYDIPLDSAILKICKEKNKAWSTINEEDKYKKIQAILKEFEEKDSATCFNWENDKWIEERSKEKDSVRNKYERYKKNANK